MKEALAQIIVAVTSLEKKVEFLIMYLNVRDNIEGRTPPQDPNRAEGELMSEANKPETLNLKP